MAKKKNDIEEIRGRFVIKTDKGYYVKRNNGFDMTEIYSDDITDGAIFSLNIIGIWFMENLKEPSEKELIEL